MTITATTARIDYTGNGTTTVFAYPFRILAATDLAVYVAGVLQTVSTHYSVSGVGQSGGGNVTFVTAPVANARVILMRDIPYTQNDDYVEHDIFSAQGLETSLDKVTMICQQVKEILNRVPTLPVASSGGFPALLLPAPSTITASGRKVLAWNSGETNLDLVELTTQQGLVGDALTANARASLPVPSSANRIRKVTDDCRGFFLETSAIWFSPMGEVLNVQDFGARPGQDSTAAFQAAFDAATGRPVYIPPGQYIISSTLNVVSSGGAAVFHTGFTLFGAGMYQSVLDNRVANGPLLNLDGGTTARFQVGGCLRDFGITTTTSPVGSRGIDIRSLWLCDIQRVRVINLTSDGVRIVNNLGDPDSTANLVMHHCWLRDLGGYGVNVATASGVTTTGFFEIDQSMIYGCALGGIRYTGLVARITHNSIYGNRGDGGVYVRRNGAGSNNIAISANEFDGNQPHHIKLDNVLAVECINNQFNHQDDGTGFGYRPTLGVVIGDGTNPVTNFYGARNRVRSTPVNPPVATTFWSVSASARGTRLEDTVWMAFSGANAIRYSENSISTMIREDGAWVREAVRFQRTTGTNPFIPDLKTGPYQQWLINGAGPSISPPINAAVDTANDLESPEMILELLNNTGSPVTPTFDAVYVTLNIPTIPAGERRTATFRYNPLSEVWVQIGAWSTSVRLLTGSGTLAPGAIAAQSVATATMTVTGAVAGDVAFASPDGSLGAGIALGPLYISATDTLSVVFVNVDVVARTPTSRTWKAVVYKA